MQARPELGREPGNGRKLTDLIERKLDDFNQMSDKEERDIVREIEKDREIEESWKWIKALGKQPEFSGFISRLHLNDSLVLPSQVGNSYTSSIFVGLTSLLSKVEYSKVLGSRKGIMVGYGSGAQSMAYTFELLPKELPQRSDLELVGGGMNSINSDQYKILHDQLIKGDAERTQVDSELKYRIIHDQIVKAVKGDAESPHSAAEMNLLHLDKELIGRQTLSEGFHVILRRNDGTGRYAYIDKDGNEKELMIRH
jgi:hypothetical protein